MFIMQGKKARSRRKSWEEESVIENIDSWSEILGCKRRQDILLVRGGFKQGAV